VLAEDHVLFRQGLKSILEKNDELEVVGEANDGLELLSLIKKTSPDMVIGNVSTSKQDCFETTRHIKTLWPAIKLLIVSIQRENEFINSAIKAGAEGYLLIEDADTELFEAIEKLRGNGYYLSPLLVNDITDELFAVKDKTSDDSQKEQLTRREIEVLKLIAEGEMNKEIADHLCISVRTVENHRANMTRKLNTRSAADLIKYAIRKGYTSASS
jgi:DNA-binding NarL/FixJ family response regulator